MAVLNTKAVYCKNKLCGHRGHQLVINDSPINVTCPKCGFGTLTERFEYVELGEAIRKARDKLMETTHD